MSIPHVRRIRVFVSSPGDVQKERAVLERVVAGINLTDGQRHDFRLELFRWESNTAPQIGPKPQAAVDDQTPSYDIYLGIMSVRFGTPTDRAESGTEEEFNAALAKWQADGAPWIMFYFDGDPDSELVDQHFEQFTKVRNFRKKLEVLGLVARYKGVEGGDETFRTKVDLHLRNVVHRILPPPTSPPPTPARPEIPPSYLAWLQSDCAGIDLLGMRLKEGQALRLTQVYVPLITPKASDESRQRTLHSPSATKIRSSCSTFSIASRCTSRVRPVQASRRSLAGLRGCAAMAVCRRDNWMDRRATANRSPSRCAANCRC